MPFIPNDRERQMLEAIAEATEKSSNPRNEHVDSNIDGPDFADHLRSLAKTEGKYPMCNHGNPVGVICACHQADSLSMSSMPEVTFTPKQVDAMKEWVDKFKHGNDYGIEILTVPIPIMFLDSHPSNPPADKK